MGQFTTIIRTSTMTADHARGFIQGKTNATSGWCYVNRRLVAVLSRDGNKNRAPCLSPASNRTGRGVSGVKAESTSNILLQYICKKKNSINVANDTVIGPPANFGLI